MARYRRQRGPRHIAPRLMNGDKRIAAGNGLPPAVKDALSFIAEQEGKSRSWVIETILLDWAKRNPRLHRMLVGAVEYMPRKTEPETAKA